MYYILQDTILGSTSPFKVFLSFHSYFELIIFPWGFKKEPCPNYLRLLEGGAIMARVTYVNIKLTLYNATPWRSHCIEIVKNFVTISQWNVDTPEDLHSSLYYVQKQTVQLASNIRWSNLCKYLHTIEVLNNVGTTILLKLLTTT